MRTTTGPPGSLWCASVSPCQSLTGDPIMQLFTIPASPGAPQSAQVALGFDQVCRLQRGAAIYPYGYFRVCRMFPYNFTVVHPCEPSVCLITVGPPGHLMYWCPPAQLDDGSLNWGLICFLALALAVVPLWLWNIRALVRLLAGVPSSSPCGGAPRCPFSRPGAARRQPDLKAPLLAPEYLVPLAPEKPVAEKPAPELLTAVEVPPCLPGDTCARQNGHKRRAPPRCRCHTVTAGARPRK